MPQQIAHVRRLDSADWPRYVDPMTRIENASFAPLSRESPADMLRTIEHPRAACFVALIRGEVAGYCLGGPLELFAGVAGVTDDPDFGRGTVLYSASLVVSEHFRGAGLARRLKRSQIIAARRQGYRWMSGRNRMCVAEPMWQLNCSLGAEPVATVRDAYVDGPEPRSCIYYHIDLEAPAHPAPTQPGTTVRRPSERVERAGHALQGLV